MKKILMAVLAVGLLSACEATVEPGEESQMVVYIIDYDTNEFQAGTVLNFEKLNIEFDEIEIDIDEDAPENGLDGAVSLLYDPTGDKIFEGSINLEGNAEINFPSVTPGDQFFEIENSVSAPATVQDISRDYTQNFGSVWSTIDNLGLTEIFMNNNAMVGRFLYQPNQNNDENWKWIILLFDQ